MGSRDPLPNDAIATLLSGYQPLSGVADELFDEAGDLRPVWRPFLNHLAGLSDVSLALALDRGSQYLRDAGVFFRQYGASATATEREWPLSHLPVLIDAADWAQIEAGLMERANLLEAVMADLYGPGDLVRQGLIPPELVAGNPEWLRPMVGVKPRSGHYLHFLAFDIGRGPDGGWWVLCDRAQAPSGAGFALENRMATARSFAGVMSASHVTRLARFFRAFRDALLQLRSDENSRVSILTPGPMNDAYYEHAYIARYLGFLLVQGEDLVVRDGRLMVQTVSGLQPVQVLWRRLDSEWLDPLELNEASAIGTPGILGALRARSFDCVNAVGSGALEVRALMAFIPRIAQALNGAPLQLPNIATWWCGGAAARDYVKANLHRMTVDRAMATGLPFDHSATVVIGGKTAGGAPVNPDWIEQEAGHLAAQEIVSLSTAPALKDGRLVPRPMSLRVFLCRTPEGWTVMPGGFARIGPSDASADVAMQKGGSVADVWVLAGKERASESLLETTATGYKRRQTGALPTRAADNLYWLGRYSERAEQKIRLLRAYHLRLAETARDDLPLTEYLGGYLDGMGLDPTQPVPEALLDDVRAALRSAGRIRDRFSVDAWNALGDLLKTLEGMASHLEPGDATARAMSVALRRVSGFTGLVHENMYRLTGWRFLSIGRALERAWATAYMVAALTEKSAPQGSVDLAIEAADSAMTHRRRFAVASSRNTAIDLLLLDPYNPRSVLHQVSALREHLSTLPRPADAPQMTPVLRAVTRLETELATGSPEDFDAQALSAVAQATADLSGLLGASHLR